LAFPLGFDEVRALAFASGGGGGSSRAALFRAWGAGFASAGGLRLFVGRGFSAGPAVLGVSGRRLRTVGGTGTREAGRSTRRARHQFSGSSGSTASALFAPDSVTGQRRSEPSAVRTASAAVGARMWPFSFGPSRCSSCTLYQFIGTYL